MSFKRCVIDIETNGLLEDGLNYSKRPYRLKSTFKIWCIVVRCLDTNEVKTLILDQCTRSNLKEILQNTEFLCGHNIINFDLPVLKLLGLLDYRVAYPDEDSTLYEKIVEISDTLILSKLLNPDRYDSNGKHSLEAWGKRVGEYKGDFHKFDEYSQEMLDYCIQDTNVNAILYKELLKEKQSLSKFQWNLPYKMEQKLADLILRQSVFGFKYDKNLAVKCLADLDQKMAVIKAKIDPLLPPRKMTKGERDFYDWPKNLFKKDGEIAKITYKFAEKIGGKLTGTKAEDAYLEFNGELYKIVDKQPLKVEMKSDLEDLDNLKSYLISLGWVPTEWKERDLLKKPDKTKKTEEEINETIERYIKQTFDGYFAKERCELLDVDCNEEAIRIYLRKLASGKKKKPIWVPTSPKITIGLDKEICKGLEELGEKAEFVKDLSHYLTYRHRRNSILGGNLEYDDNLDEDELDKGFLAYVREDGRISTPADTLGANTARFRHKIVCNIPRVSSLYGKEMRGQFCCGPWYWQLGFDFASLEARIQGHYCLPYKNGEELAKTLLAVKPNDLHSLNAKKLNIHRDLAKSISYASLYGAQPKKIAKMAGCDLERGEQLYQEYWDSVPALKELKEKVEKHWADNLNMGIQGLDGRMLVTRSKHSLINVLFQSGGALLVKWAMVLISQLMEKHNILGDPFVDDETAIKLFQMIVNHDEAQYAAHPKLFDVKVFKDDAEAKENLKPGCSAIGHGSKGPYVGYKTLPIVCIEEGIKKAQKFLNIRTEMGIEWILGLNWAMCH